MKNKERKCVIYYEICIPLILFIDDDVTTVYIEKSINKRVLIDWWQIYKASIESKIVIYWLLNQISVFIDFYRIKNVHDLIFKRANHLNQHFNSKYFEYLCMFVYWYSRKSKSVLIKIFLFHFSFQVRFTAQSKHFDSYF